MHLLLSYTTAPICLGERPPGRPRRRPAPGNGGIACGQRHAEDLPPSTSSSGPRGRRRDPSGAAVQGQVVLLLAGDHALVAADALGGIGEDGRLHLVVLLAVYDRRDFQPRLRQPGGPIRVAQRGGHPVARAGGELPGDRSHHLRERSQHAMRDLGERDHEHDQIRRVHVNQHQRLVSLRPERRFVHRNPVTKGTTSSNGQA